MSEKEKQDGYMLVKNYLKEHSLVESNITSFNNFIEEKMQEIVEDLNENLPVEDFEISLGKIRVGKPNVIEADGSTSLVTPTEARLRNLTYSAPVYLEIGVKREGQNEQEEVEIGRIPVMVGSNICNKASLTEEEKQEHFIDPKDPGGYFLLNGNERVMVLMEDLAANQPFIEEKKGNLMLRLFSQRGAYRIPISITETKEGIIETSFSRFQDIPIVVLLKALGMEKDSDIAKFIGKETDSVIVNLYEFSDINSIEDAMLWMAEKANLQGTKKEILDRVKQRIDNYFMPHIGTEEKNRQEKAVTLCKFVKQFIIAKENTDVYTDKDHYANKRVKLSGDLLSDLFRVNLNILVRDIQYSLSKTIKRKKYYSLKTIAKSTLFSHRVESAFATGSWIGQRTGVTQNMDKTNYLSILSQLQRVTSVLPGEIANFMARTLHPTHYGRFCPIETPEGTEIGLRKNLALLARVSTDIPLNEEAFVKKLQELGMELHSSEKQKEFDVFFNGRFIGSVEKGSDFMKKVVNERRQNKLPIQLNIRLDKLVKTIYISTEVGRVLRPLIIVENGKNRMTEDYKNKVEKGEIGWKDLLEKGVIEYLDASEEENALVAVKEEDITEKHTHVEIDPVASLGTITSLVPYANHDHPPRLLRGSKTLKQGLGIYSGNFPIRVDTDVSILHYPQKPIVKSFVYDTLDMHPAGQNMVVAIMTYEGYNLEDAIVMNKGSIDRGLARSTYFRPYSAIELKYAGNLKDEITVPEKDVSGYKTEESYKYLEDDGLVYPEAKLDEGEVVIGKTSPPKFLSEARNIAIRTRKETSEVIRQEEKGIVDAVFLTTDREGNKVSHARTRDPRIPELGDKFSNPHGQKGVVGLIVPEQDIPFTSRGIKPDLIFNPHGIPSRMSMGYLIELLAGKMGSIAGRAVDGTPFAGEKVEDIEKNMRKMGFRYDGKETMFDPITGKQMKAKIFIGSMYYLKLKYMVSNKIHARASGKVQLLTRQPIEGRAKGGALRLGEMEQQALVAHGSSLLLKERYDSDKVVVHVCKDCGSLAIEDKMKNKIKCPFCKNSESEPIEISYAFKLLLEELQGMHIYSNFELKNKYEE